jgi:signal transduction histidine kinase
MSRPLASYSAVAALVVGVVFLNVLFLSYDKTRPDRLTDVLYLAVATMFLSLQEVRVEHGRLTLHAIVLGAATILTNPLDATVIGLIASFGQARRGTWPLIGNAAVQAAINCLAAVVAAELRHGYSLALVPRFGVLLTLLAANVALAPTLIWIRTGEGIGSVARKTFTPSFVVAFGYLALAALLMSYVIDGSVLGYFLATIVCVLALALTDTIAGRRVRTVLESELSDADRHLFHSRAVEGVVHNLRNHVATALAYLREIDPRRLESVDRDSLVMATEATNDAVSVLRSLEQGATPKVTYALTPVDLNELAVRAVGMARPRARPKEVQLAIRESAADVRVHADPLLLREVITNLINNAIDAAGVGGRVDVSTGMRPNGWAFVSVADTGPGVPDEYRHRLFEPHFTTKESGTGLGLFMSYGIVREHQGQLNYEGNRRGAVFTVTLPPFV